MNKRYALFAAPLLAAALTVNMYAAPSAFSVIVPLDTVIRVEPGVPVGTRYVLAVVEVPDSEREGTQCLTTLTAENNSSVHPGNNIIVESQNSITFFDVEDGEFTQESQTGLQLGDVVTVTLAIGTHRLPKTTYSGGLTIEVTCPIPTPTSTPTMTSTPTFTPTPTSTATPTFTPTATLTPVPTGTAPTALTPRPQPRPDEFDEQLYVPMTSK